LGRIYGRRQSRLKMSVNTIFGRQGRRGDLRREKNVFNVFIKESYYQKIH
jgi:hypothetical protein